MIFSKEIERGNEMTTEYEQYRMALEAKAAEFEQTLWNRKLIAIENTPCDQAVQSAQRELARAYAWSRLAAVARSHGGPGSNR
jgi:hypothetical protein